MAKVVDPALLAQLNDPATPVQKVTDPDLLAQLNGEVPVEEEKKNWAWEKAKQSFGALNDTREAFLKTITGIPGSIAGDVAGLGTTSLGILANLAQKRGLVDQETVDKIDPSAVQASVADALTYEPSNPESLPNQILEAPGAAIGWTGDKMMAGAEKAGITNPIALRTIQAIPRAAVELAGVKGGKAALKPAAVAEEVVPPPVRDAVPDTPPTPPTVAAGPALPNPVKALPGPEGIPQAPPRAPLEEAPKAAPQAPKPPLAKNKNASIEDLDKQAVDNLLSEDIRLSKDQRGSGWINKLAGSADRASNALIGKGKFAREQLQDFTRAVFNKVGIKAKNATAESMAELKQKVTDDYNAAHADLNIKMDGELVVDLKEIQAKAHRNADVERKLDKMFDHIGRNAKADGTITAEAAESIRSELGKMQGSANGAVADFAREMKDALDAATERSAPPARLKQLKDARKQFHFMRQIEGAIDTKNGLISPRKLVSVINRKRNKNEAFYGAGDQSLVNLANSAAKVLPEVLADSGTATRISDIFKLTEPVTAAKAAAAAFGGRVFNQGGARTGTPSYIAEKVAADARGTPPANALVRQAITETEEEKRRRLRAAAMRE